jgi:hypothetical protein
MHVTYGALCHCSFDSHLYLASILRPRIPPQARLSLRTLPTPANPQRYPPFFISIRVRVQFEREVRCRIHFVTCRPLCTSDVPRKIMCRGKCWHSAQRSLVYRRGVDSLQTANHPWTKIHGSVKYCILFYFSRMLWTYRARCDTLGTAWATPNNFDSHRAITIS